MYKSDIAYYVLVIFQSFRKSGLSYKNAITTTMKELNLSKASVNSYLPYEKGVYFPQDTDSDNLSVGAERIRWMCKRENSLEKLKIERNEKTL